MQRVLRLLETGLPSSSNLASSPAPPSTTIEEDIVALCDVLKQNLLAESGSFASVGEGDVDHVDRTLALLRKAKDKLTFVTCSVREAQLQIQFDKEPPSSILSNAPGQPQLRSRAWSSASATGRSASHSLGEFRRNLTVLNRKSPRFQATKVQSLSTLKPLKTFTGGKAVVVAPAEDAEAKKEVKAVKVVVPPPRTPPPRAKLKGRSASEAVFQHNHVGVDIGGTLVKVAFFVPNEQHRSFPPDVDELAERDRKFMMSHTQYGSTGQREEALSIPFQNGRLHFINFHTNRLVTGACALIKKHRLLETLTHPVGVCGGGAYKYEKPLTEQLGVNIAKKDELRCLLTGLNQLIQHVPNECYTLDANGEHDYLEYNDSGDLYPHLLVNIGSGVSILLIHSAEHFERVGGSCIGGGTYHGLCRLTTDCGSSFKSAMDLACKGNIRNVSSTVGDIYGGDYKVFNLEKTTIASAFGKVANASCNQPRDVDAAAGLLHMIGGNIAQLAYLTAKCHKVNRILFAGSFLRHNVISAAFLSESIDYWSDGAISALFLRHEGYLGSIGAMVNQSAMSAKQQNQKKKKKKQKP